MEEKAKGITDVVRVADLGRTPGCVNRRTGVMYISMKHINNMPKEHILFMMLHEKAHVELQTNDENLADEQAFKEYAALGYSLKESVKALTRVLDDKNPSHNWRMYQQLQRAEKYDIEKNGNTKLLNHA
ncbi:hypothetical protein I5M32_11250 [Pedobacter sp. SD-b]|uniref:IrrE N-terminal-like domain-containing protein n=1 Tax=Pedobacter segetis TaxID=2793069 RepID=A0ABS1BKW9_9SPHI|nr:hypothetical protein [Pedobacter segetis]MBK0383533.1 hypothetical protein [Pedobacter segetis]